MKALVIGRFQPVHLGHVALLEGIDSMGLEKILLGIGVEGKGRTERNPFHYQEIKEMLEPVVAKLETPVEMYPIPDIHDSANYAVHVETITGCSENDTIVVSGNEYTLDCFTNYGKNYQTGSIEKRVPVETGYICATKVRECIRTGGPWRDYVPKTTEKFIESKGDIFERCA